MIRLEDLSLGNRIAITVAIVVAITFMLALYGYLTGRWEMDEDGNPLSYSLASAESRPEPKPLCMDDKMRERIRVILYEAVDEALKEQVVRLYSVWLKDDAGQPGRARVGTDQAVAAYVRAYAGIETWSPPPCAN